MGPRWGPCRGRSSSMPAAPAARLQCTASRQLELRQLPPVLCFSLQRFVFDFQVGPGWGWLGWVGSASESGRDVPPPPFEAPPLLSLNLTHPPTPHYIIIIITAQRMDRVKVSDKFAFPLALDMGPVINEVRAARHGCC